MRKLFLLLVLLVSIMRTNAQSNTCFADFTFTQGPNNTLAVSDKSKPDTFALINSRIWSSFNGQTATGLTATFTYPNPGLFNVCLVIKTSSGCQDTVCKMIQVGPPPKPCRSMFDFAVDNSTKTVQFYNQSQSDSGLIDGVLWKFGDVQNSGDWNAVHTYNFYGDYNVKLIINVSSNGCTDSLVKMVKIHDDSLCKPDFGFSPTDTTGMSFTFLDYSLGNPTNRMWNFGDGSASVFDFEPSHTFMQPGFYNVCLTVYDSVSLCSKTFCKIVQAGKLGCKAFFRADHSFLNPKVITFKNESLGAFTKLLWNFGDGSNSGDTVMNLSHEYLSNGYYNACLTIFDDVSNCSNEYCQTIQIGTSGCFANFEAYPDSNNNLALQFMNNSMGSVSKAFWEFGDGTTANTFHALHTYSNPGNYEVCLSVFDSVNACQNRICRFIKIGNVGCIADFIFFVDSSTNTVAFQNESASNTGTPMHKFWKFGDGSFADKANPTHTYMSPGYYEVCLTVFDSSNGCQNTKCQTVKVGGNTNLACLAKYSFFPEPTSLKVNFSADPSSGNLTHFYWDFGNGSHSIDKNTSYTFMVSGYHNVCLTVMDSITGCHNTVCNQILVGTSNATPCLAKYSFFPDTVTKSINFHDESLGNITHRYWDFGDGVHSTETHPSHPYSASGIYTVCLSVYDSTGKCQNTVCNPLELGQGHCWVDFMFTISSTNDLTVHFQGNVQGDPTHGLWEFGDGSTEVDVLNPVHTYTNSGFYNVCASVFDSVTNCHKRICKSIKVGSLGCRSEFTFFIDSVTNKVIFKALALGNISNYHWDFGDGTHSYSAQTSHIYSQPGFYNVCLYSHDSLSNCGDHFCLPIQIGQVGASSCQASYEYYVDPTSKSVAFTSHSIMGTNGTIKYFWDFGDATSSRDANPTHVYMNSGMYKVCLAVKDSANGCHDLVCEMIQVGSADCNADYTFFNDGSNKIVNFYDKSFGPSTLKRFWDFGDGEHSKELNPVHTYLSPGFYATCLAVWDSTTSCVDHHCIPIRVMGADCQSSFSYFVDSTNNTVNFSNQSLGNPTKWFWEFGDGTVSLEQNPNHTYPHAGFFNVCLAVYNSANGCHNIDCQVVMISQQFNDCEASFEYFADATTRKVNFTDNSMGNPTHRFWNMGDGIGFSTTTNPTYTYSTPGYYEVCLTIYNSQTRCHDTYCQVVNVSDAKHCKARFDRYVDSTQTAFFDDVSFGNPDKWYWTFGDGDTSLTQNPSHLYSQAGLYKVCLKIKNTQTNCVDHKTRLVKIKDQNGLYAGFSHVIDSAYSCKNCASTTYPVKFNGESWGDPAKWAWNFGDGGIDTVNKNVTYEYSDPGSYKVCLTVSDPSVGLSDTQCDTVTVGLVGIKEVQIINKSMLYNYPNPFNESTVVYYSTVSSGQVKLEVFDLMGKKITQLVNESEPAGKYVIEWNSGKLQSGVYFIKLTTGNETLVQKMSVLR